MQIRFVLFSLLSEYRNMGHMWEEQQIWATFAVSVRTVDFYWFWHNVRAFIQSTFSESHLNLCFDFLPFRLFILLLPAPSSHYSLTCPSQRTPVLSFILLVFDAYLVAAFHHFFLSPWEQRDGRAQLAKSSVRHSFTFNLPRRQRSVFSIPSDSRLTAAETKS